MLVVYSQTTSLNLTICWIHLALETFYFSCCCCTAMLWESLNLILCYGAAENCRCIHQASYRVACSENITTWSYKVSLLLLFVCTLFLGGPQICALPPCFHILKCQFLLQFKNICLTFCQPAEEEKQTPVNIVWQNKKCNVGMWSEWLLCLGAGGRLEHTQQEAGAWFAALNSFSFSKSLYRH